MGFLWMPALSFMQRQGKSCRRIQVLYACPPSSSRNAVPWEIQDRKCFAQRRKESTHGPSENDMWRIIIDSAFERRAKSLTPNLSNAVFRIMGCVFLCAFYGFARAQCFWFRAG